MGLIYRIRRIKPLLFLVLISLYSIGFGRDIVSVQSGNWSDPSTWDGNSIPGQGDNVLVDSGHVVLYNAESTDAIRLIHIRGKLEFDRTRNTLLEVGMIIINTSETVDVNWDCSAHHGGPSWESVPRPALEIGTLSHPVPENYTARIRLVYFSDMDPDCAPGIMNYGGRMDINGAPLNKTWLKLDAPANQGDNVITIEEPVDWNVGDRIFITGTVKNGNFPNVGSYRNNGLSQTEERTITAINGVNITLDQPLQFDHSGQGDYRADVANLSRNVIIESKDPAGVRGHTMYHYGSRGNTSYAEFAHLGKRGKLARYPIHYHVLRDSNRGSVVLGNSIWDSHNRFITIHATDYLVVRDNVGYKSLGHGIFMEDATEVNNFLWNNISVLAYDTSPLPNQAIPYDDNDGAGFWWANGQNAFLNNTAAECDQYGYLFDIRSDIYAPILQPDGTIRQNVHVEELPFILFKDNEAHGTLKYGYWGNGHASPTNPFIMENTKLWKNHYLFALNGYNYFIKNLDLYRGSYGFYGPNPKSARIEGFYASLISNPTIMAYHRPEGLITFDNVHIDSPGSYPFRITGKKQRNDPCDIHVRNLTLTNYDTQTRGATSEGSAARSNPDLTLYLHDFFGANQDAKVIPDAQSRNDGLNYSTMNPPFDNNVKVAQTSVSWPTNPIQPVDNLAPATVIVYPSDEEILPAGTSQLTVYGTCIDANTVTTVTVNGVTATATSPNFRTWEVTLSGISPGTLVIEAFARDEFGNVEQHHHRIGVGIGGNPTGTDDSGQVSNLPQQFKLEDNFPNPFNPETTIRFVVSNEFQTASLVQLNIYDVLGNKVKTLVSESLAPGEYQTVWDGRDNFNNQVSTGVYIYELVASIPNKSSKFRMAKKMLLIQ